jgi:RHS repeat-associated protein
LHRPTWYVETDDSGLRRQGQTTSAAGYKSYAIDANGSVEGLESSDGALATNNTYNYDPYGEIDASGMSDEAKAAPFRFQGFYSDTAVQTYDMQARSYRPDVGRFLSQDRFEAASADIALQSDPLTQNRYAFAGGNPINNVEFDGHEPEGSYTNGCDNTYGSDERCRRNPRVDRPPLQWHRPTRSAATGREGAPARRCRTSHRRSAGRTAISRWPRWSTRSPRPHPTPRTADSTFVAASIERAPRSARRSSTAPWTSRYRWPPLRLARLCCEHESVCVVVARLISRIVLTMTRRSVRFIGPLLARDVPSAASRTSGPPVTLTRGRFDTQLVGFRAGHEFAEPPVDATRMLRS